jgi:hypothetical protein
MSFINNSRNSRFGGFNSRLGVNKFPFGRQRELAGKRLIYLAVFDAKTALLEHNREKSRFDGKNREFSPAAAAASCVGTGAAGVGSLTARPRRRVGSGG